MSKSCVFRIQVLLGRQSYQHDSQKKFDDAYHKVNKPFISGIHSLARASFPGYFTRNALRRTLLHEAFDTWNAGLSQTAVASSIILVRTSHLLQIKRHFPFRFHRMGLGGRGDRCEKEPL